MKYNSVEYWKNNFNEKFHGCKTNTGEGSNRIYIDADVHEKIFQQSNMERKAKSLNDLVIKISITYQSNMEEVEEFCKSICPVINTTVAYSSGTNGDNKKNRNRRFKRQRVARNNDSKGSIASGEVMRLIDRFVKRTFFQQRKDPSVEQESRTLKFMQSLKFPSVTAPILCITDSAKGEDDVKICIERETIYLMGNYLKHLRGLPQSPWSINGVRKGISSVQEYLAENIIKLYEPESYKFHSSGREDIDVRMLGNGRPYALELINCKMCPIRMSHYLSFVEKITNETYDAVESNSLRWCTQEDPYVSLEANCEDKNKTYACVCCVSKGFSAEELVEKLDALSSEPLTVMQKTPIRVLHRRPNLNRTRHIYSMKTQWLNRHFFILTLVAEAGTYIKEFVHSDFGRTRPNVGELLGSGVDADILQLDVLSVNFKSKTIDGKELK